MYTPAKYLQLVYRSLRMRPVLLFLVFCFFQPATASARLTWLAQGGMGMAYGSVNSRIDKEGDRYRVDISPWVTPAAGISALVPLTGRLSLEPGLIYSRKGFRGIDEFTFFDASRAREVLFDTRYRLHYLSIPIQLNYTFIRRRNHMLLLGGGMNYAFLLSGSNDYFTRQVSWGDVYEDWFRDNKISKGLMQTKNTYAGTMSTFDAGIRLQLSYVFRSRFVLRLFHEQSLYSVYLKEPESRPAVRLRYTGFSMGILLPRFSPADKAATLAAD